MYCAILCDKKCFILCNPYEMQYLIQNCQVSSPLGLLIPIQEKQPERDDEKKKQFPSQVTQLFPLVHQVF
jgi:hypothetical protein